MPKVVSNSCWVGCSDALITVIAAREGAPSAAGDDTATPAVQGNGDSKGEEVVAKGASAARGEVFDLIPIRLSQRERDLFSVLEGTLQVSEYTDVVDTYR